MNYFIKNIHINKLFHLENLDIPIDNEKYPHLIITGKNGSGKTMLLNVIADVVSKIGMADGKLSTISSENVTVAFTNNIQPKPYIAVFYQASRITNMLEPQNPTKPEYAKSGNIRHTATSQFLYFLSDLKIQEALARNEKQYDDADKINVWFADFEKLLQQIFQDKDLKLEFNYKDYSFKICTEGKKFRFTQMSDGFAAALDIVADLILKMQDDDSLTRAYEKEGIVLIDEIETHLHLELQKIIMPFLATTFPNIQFIVTTHSPFVLSSMPNAVAYDLEHRKPIEDLSNYSYESLTEGYFRVSTESSSVEMRINRLKDLFEQKERSDSDKNEIRLLMTELDKVSEAVSPDLVGEYISLKLNHINIIKEIGK